jgi:hypothetical protein
MGAALLAKRRKVREKTPVSRKCTLGQGDCTEDQVRPRVGQWKGRKKSWGQEIKTCGREENIAK